MSKLIKGLQFVFVFVFLLCAVGGFASSFVSGLMFVFAALVISPLPKYFLKMKDSLRRNIQILCSLVLMIIGFAVMGATAPASEQEDIIPERTNVLEIETTETTTETTSATTETTTTTTALTTTLTTATEETTETTIITTTTEQATEPPTTLRITADYVVNTSSGKYHKPYCSSVDDMKEENKMQYNGTQDELKAMGYQPCGRCFK